MTMRILLTITLSLALCRVLVASYQSSCTVPCPPTLIQNPAQVCECCTEVTISEAPLQRIGYADPPCNHNPNCQDCQIGVDWTIVPISEEVITYAIERNGTLYDSGTVGLQPEQGTIRLIAECPGEAQWKLTVYCENDEVDYQGDGKLDCSCLQVAE